MLDGDRALRDAKYFADYRAKKVKLQSLRSRLKDLYQTVSDTKDEISACDREVGEMRKTIIAMIELDIDSTEARLRDKDDLIISVHDMESWTEAPF
jgi:predicted  nucleic acid-binding Zn-ribbon protein